MKTILVTVILCCCSVGLSVRAPQGRRDGGSLAFDVVSLKPDESSTLRGRTAGCRGTDAIDPPRNNVPMGMCVGTGATPEMLLALAYDINPQIKGSLVGEPGWFTQERYNLQAKSENPPSLAELRLMLRAVLADRFRLRSHIEERELDGMVLLIGKNGPQLKRPSRPEEYSGGMGFKFEGDTIQIANRSLNLINVPLDYAAKQMARMLGLPIVNKTGVTGNYDVIVPSFSAPNDLNSTSPTLPDAIQHLGLRLENQKVLVPVLIVDGAEKPTFD